VILSNAVTVPDLGGRSAGEAQDMLEGLGLEVRFESFTGEANRNSRVFAQDPGANNRVEPGSTVVVRVFG
jgi:serine/threonine-protein kinase